MRVLFDTCIIVDFLLNRKEFADEAEKVIIPVTEKMFYGFITVKSLMDTHYIIKKYLHDEEKTREILNILLQSFILVDSTKQDAINALTSDIKDFEDALMVETAKNIKADYIVSRNIKDFKKSVIPTVTSKQLLSIISS